MALYYDGDYVLGVALVKTVIGGQIELAMLPYKYMILQSTTVFDEQRSLTVRASGKAVVDIFMLLHW